MRTFQSLDSGKKPLRLLLRRMEFIDVTLAGVPPENMLWVGALIVVPVITLDARGGGKEAISMEGWECTNEGWRAITGEIAGGAEVPGVTLGGPRNRFLIPVEKSAPKVARLWYSF